MFNGRFGLFGGWGLFFEFGRVLLEQLEDFGQFIIIFVFLVSGGSLRFHKVPQCLDIAVHVVGEVEIVLLPHPQLIIIVIQTFLRHPNRIRRLLIVKRLPLLPLRHQVSPQPHVTYDLRDRPRSVSCLYILRIGLLAADLVTLIVIFCFLIDEIKPEDENVLADKNGVDAALTLLAARQFLILVGEGVVKFDVGGLREEAFGWEGGDIDDAESVEGVGVGEYLGARGMAILQEYNLLTQFKHLIND